MANGVLDQPQLSGFPDPNDALLIVDVDAGTPKLDRHVLWSTLVMAAGALIAPVQQATAPTANADETLGFAFWSQWLDTTGPTLYVCTDPTEGAAVWRVLADWS